MVHEANTKSALQIYSSNCDENKTTNKKVVSPAVIGSISNYPSPRATHLTHYKVIWWSFHPE
jgi:hypothetical protein